MTTSRFRNRSLLSTPSSRKLLEASRAPETLRPTLPCVDSREPGAGGAMPGTCCANCSASRSRTGSEPIVSRFDHLADGAVARHQRRAIGGDVDVLVDGPRLQHDAERALDRRLQPHVAQQLGLEADAGGGDQVRPWREERDDHRALRVGRAAPADAAVAVGQHDGDVGHHRVGGVADLDGERGGRRLGARPARPRPNRIAATRAAMTGSRENTGRPDGTRRTDTYASEILTAVTTAWDASLSSRLASSSNRSTTSSRPAACIRRNRTQAGSSVTSLAAPADLASSIRRSASPAGKRRLGQVEPAGRAAGMRPLRPGARAGAPEPPRARRSAAGEATADRRPGRRDRAPGTPTARCRAAAGNAACRWRAPRPARRSLRARGRPPARPRRAATHRRGRTQSGRRGRGRATGGSRTPRRRRARRRRASSPCRRSRARWRRGRSIDRRRPRPPRGRPAPAGRAPRRRRASRPAARHRRRRGRRGRSPAPAAVRDRRGCCPTDRGAPARRPRRPAPGRRRPGWPARRRSPRAAAGASRSAIRSSRSRRSDRGRRWSRRSTG